MSQHLKSKRPILPLFLIQTGNFLEFFDIFLSIHMSMVLNMVFFSHISPLFSVFIFCLSFTLRPLGAFIFGYLGDIWGRKRIIVMTTLTTGICSLGIALLPSYNTIGGISSLMFVIFRMLQGISSVGEAAGCCVYIAETVQPPKVHFHMTLTDFFGDMGSLMALLLSSVFLLLDPVNGWRYAFLCGALTALLGGFARKYLTETPDFQTPNLLKSPSIQQLLPQTSDLKNLIYYFMVECGMPLSIYFTYVYMGGVLKADYGLTDLQIIQHNTYVVCLEALWVFTYATLSLKVNPLNILKIRIVAFALFLTLLPFLMKNAQSSLHILALQGLFTLLGRGADPAHALFIRSFPGIRRYTHTALAFALPRTLMYIVTAYGCVLLNEKYGFKGIAGLFLGFAALSLLGALRFKKEGGYRE